MLDRFNNLPGGRKNLDLYIQIPCILLRNEPERGEIAERIWVIHDLPDRKYRLIKYIEGNVGMGRIVIIIPGCHIQRISSGSESRHRICYRATLVIIHIGLIKIIQYDRVCTVIIKNCKDFMSDPKTCSVY